MKLNPTGDLVILSKVPPPPREDKHPAYDLCPREWETHEVDPIQSMQDLVVTKYEYAFFAEIARAWNQSPRAWRKFPEFLHLVYLKARAAAGRRRSPHAARSGGCSGGDSAGGNATFGAGRGPCRLKGEMASNESRRPLRSPSYGPSATLDMLRLRRELLAFTHAFFRSHGFWEVEDALLSHDVAVDAYLEPFVTRAPRKPRLPTPAANELFLQHLPNLP